MYGARRLGQALLLACTFLALPARADRAACVAAYEHAQQRRMERKLAQAKKELLACMNEECPASLRQDCGTWLAEVDAAMPTVVVAATDSAGNDVVDVRVSLDGTVVTERLDGSEMALDPGEHTLRLEHGAAVPIEKKIVARSGEKLRRIPVVFSATPAVAPPPREEPEVTTRRSPTMAYVIGGVGVVASATGAVTALLAFHQKSVVDSECPARVCSPTGKSALDSGRTYGTISTIAFAAGIAGVGAAAVLLLTGSSAGAPTASVRPVVTVDARAAYAGLGGAF